MTSRCWIEEMKLVFTTGCHSYPEKKGSLEFLLFVAVWMNLEDIVLRKASWAQKGSYYMF